MVSLTNKYYKLLSNYSETPLQDARALLSYVLNGQDPLLIWRELTIDEEEKMLSCIEERKKGTPIAYITGKKEFMGLDFIVNKHTLIPRPDTETIVETLLEINPFKSPHITDLCCGSGCIGISLARFINESRVTMWDISEPALQVAQKNIEKHHLSHRVKVQKGNVLLDSYPQSDIIVSNPPYIANSVCDLLEVSKHEPLIALKGGEDGLDFYRAMTKKAYDAISHGGILAYEIGYDQAEAVKAIVEEYFSDVQIKKDLADNDRMVYAFKK